MADEEKLAETIAAPELNMEDAFGNLFKTSSSGTGEEELLRIASTYSRQFSAKQIKALLYLEWWLPKRSVEEQKRLRTFIDKYLELKQYNNSDAFVMKALEHIALRKFINENTMKVNIEK